MAHPFYLFLKNASRPGVKLFSGRVDIESVENIPDDGAVILAPNHQGAFMDALLMGVFAKRSVYFLTRADIFKKPWVISILKAMHMIAIYRIRDGIQSLSQNDEVFNTCYDLLAQNKAVLIFPEGNHNANHYLRPISKGTSRLALEARQALDPNKKLYIVPAGINYFSHRHAFAAIKVKFGKPLDADEYVELYKEHKQKAYNKFRADLTQSMKDVLIMPEQGENYEERRRFIFQPKHEKLSVAELKALADSGAFEERPPRKLGAFAKFMVAFLTIFNIVPILGLKKILPVFKDPAFKVSIKYLVGTFFHILWWSLIFALGVIFISWEAGLLFAFTAIVMAFARQSIIKY